MKAAKYITLIIAGLLLATTINAQGFGERKQLFDGDGPRMGRDRMMEKMDLADEQKESMDKIRMETLKEMLPLKNSIAEKKAQLHTLQTTEKADINKINLMIDEIAEIKTKMAKKRAATHQQIRSLLSDEQRVLFDSRPPRGERGFEGRGAGYGQGYGKHGKPCRND
jgi:Spy/CpxP family protein refolding chaperone